MNLFETALNPANKQVKRMMGQPDQGSLSTRPKRPSGKGRNRRLGGNNNQLSAQDLISLFQSMPVPNRGFKNPNASKPSQMGQGMAWFDENNSPDKVAGRLDRQNTEDWKRIQRGNNMGAAAVDFVKQTKGYTGADGVFVPPTMPAEPSSAYGSGSVAFTDTPTRGTMTDPLTGKQVFMDEYLPQQSKVQDTKYGAMPGQENGGALGNPRVAPKASASDMAALFPGPSAAPAQAQTQPTFQPGLPMDTPGAASEMSRKASRFLPQGQVTPAQANVPAGPSWFDQKVAEVGGMMPEMPQILSQNGILPDLWNGLVAGGLGVGDIYANTLGRPLDQFLFGIQPPAEPSNNMEQYQKSKGMKQGWW